MLNGEKISNRMVAFKNVVAIKHNGADNQCILIINAQSEGLKNAIQENENTIQLMTDEAQLNKFSCSGKLNCKLSRYRTSNKKTA